MAGRGGGVAFPFTTPDLFVTVGVADWFGIAR